MANQQPTSSPSSRRQALVFGAAALVAGAGFAGSAAAAGSADAELFALRERLDAALREMSAVEMFDPPPGINAVSLAYDERLTASGDELEEVCWAIVECPPAQTAEGRALKAAAAMHHLKFAFDGNGGGWSGSGEELAWNVLSDVAGAAYVPVTRPPHLAHTEPERA